MKKKLEIDSKPVGECLHPEMHARHKHIRTHIHTDGQITDTRLTALCLGLPGQLVQKGKTDLDFTEARDSKWQWHQLGHMQACTSLQTDKHPTRVFYRPDALPAAQPTASKH